MEGSLWKWTNYWSGWQPRWFILDNGILSYYNSPDVVNNGTKGSIKMSVCDVIVHSQDKTRLDLVIPGEQHFHLKASNERERQQWLVALGSCKASLQTISTKDQNGHPLTSDRLRTKKSELRLYCDLLMQQVLSVKTTAVNNPTPEKLDDVTALLSETCDTFIHTLEDCMALVEGQNRSGAGGQEVSSSTIDASLPSSPVRPSFTRSPSQSSGDRIYIRHYSDPTDTLSSHPNVRKPSYAAVHNSPSRSVASSVARSSKHDTDSGDDSDDDSFKDTTGDAVMIVDRASSSASSGSRHSSASIGRVFPSSNQGNSSNQGDCKPRPRPSNFFSSMTCSFTSFKLGVDESIPSDHFLQCCQATAGIFDKLSATTFAPVKSDFTGNIKKINQKFSTNPSSLTSLQKIVLLEVERKQNLDPNSATQALLWLRRGLDFIRELLMYLAEGEETKTAGYKAYEHTLKPHHNFVVKGVFSLAMQAAPYRKDFLEKLSNDSARMQVPLDEYMTCLMEDMKLYSTGMGRVTKVISTFYMKHHLDS